MRFLITTFLRGLSVVVPVALTIALIVWSIATTESLLHAAFVATFSEHFYQPGMGILLGTLFVFVIGFLLRSLFIQRFWNFVEEQLERLPIIKTVYDSFRDFFGFFTSKAASDASAVVLVDVGNGASLVGFVTEDDAEKLPRLRNEQAGQDAPDRVAVFLPMSYQLGGYTLLVSRDKLTELDWSVEKALRFVLTAGIGRNQEGASDPRPTATNPTP